MSNKFTMESPKHLVDDVLFMSPTNDGSDERPTEVTFQEDEGHEASLHNRNHEKKSELATEREIMATTTDDDGIPSPSHPMEKRVLRKMDIYLIPLMGLLLSLIHI